MAVETRWGIPKILTLRALKLETCSDDIIHHHNVVPGLYYRADGKLCFVDAFQEHWIVQLKKDKQIK